MEFYIELFRQRVRLPPFPMEYKGACRQVQSDYWHQTAWKMERNIKPILHGSRGDRNYPLVF